MVRRLPIMASVWDRISVILTLNGSAPPSANSEFRNSVSGIKRSNSPAISIPVSHAGATTSQPPASPTFVGQQPLQRRGKVGDGCNIRQQIERHRNVEPVFH